MKILTKQWAKKREQVRLVQGLEVFDSQAENCESIKSKARKVFCDSLFQDFELAKDCLKSNVVDKLYEAKVERDRKLLL